MKIYKREISPIMVYETNEYTTKRFVPTFETWYPEDQEEELRKTIFETYPEAFAEIGVALAFDERYVETNELVEENKALKKEINEMSWEISSMRSNFSRSGEMGW